ncbi:MAG TPA: FAD:protein FMN transferase [Caldimonas sp.]|nr:FAD:protein FMN transferase [Caldimonas sp.]HEX4234713.1 FAD:protein FMN transferase [Caldimonas sp.]
MGRARLRPRSDRRAGAGGWSRRAQPLLGTLVDIGARGVNKACAAAAVGAAFDRIRDIEAKLSRFIAQSVIGRFNGAGASACIALDADAARVLAAAQWLRLASAGLFDVSLGSGATGWRCSAGTLHKLADGVTLDLGGIGKGFAVDAAIAALRAQGAESGWVNAGGDLRVFGPLGLPIDLRDETNGGVRRFATLGDGAFATSRLVTRAGAEQGERHASVAAPTCLWADALTKVVIASGDSTHPLVGRLGARAWLH